MANLEGRSPARFWSLASGGAPHKGRWPRYVLLKAGPYSDSHRDILRLQSLDALANIPIVDMAAIHFHEVAKCRRFVARSLVRRGELIVQRHASFVVEIGQLESLFVPANGRFRHAFVEEALGEPGIGLHYLRERMATIHRLTNFL